jgi:hypothetical protein
MILSWINSPPAEVSTHKYYFFIMSKMKNKKYHTVVTIPKSNIKIIERGKINNSNTKIHDL